LKVNKYDPDQWILADIAISQVYVSLKPIYGMITPVVSFITGKGP
jgi:hypothetical protein